MNWRVKYIFLAALLLIILTQILILHWSPTAVFFVTWFLLALVIQHDSRISIFGGLVFLSTCPFLLIAQREQLAEQAANFAYFFLAIGVLVQLEEMILERIGWLNRKVDLSFLWLPVSGVILKGWTAGFKTYRKLIKRVDRKLPREQAVERLKIPSRLLWGGFVLVFLPILISVMIWLSGIQNANQIAHLQTSYDFILHLDQAIFPIPADEGDEITEQNWTINQEDKPVLYQPPPLTGTSRILYQTRLGNDNKLAFNVAMDPACWGMDGDGVAFRVYIVADGITYQVFSKYIDPKHNPADQRWYQTVIDLDKYAGKLVTIIFETNTGPMGDFRYDWSGWGEPRLLHP